MLGSRIQDEDIIIIVKSSGIHANGLTLCRDIEELLPKGYMTELPSGITYGEALLAPTIIYSPLINACAHLLHYAVNITGHGWRKLMRAQQPFQYQIEIIPEAPEIFEFIQEYGKVDNREAFGNLNMGGGYALYASKENEEGILKIAKSLGFDAFKAGHIVRANRKSVVLFPLDIFYEADELKVR